MIEEASHSDFSAIAALNVAAYEEFAPSLPSGAWELMQKNLQNVAERAKTSHFLICRVDDAVVGSVAYCPAGNGDPSVFTPNMASVLLLAVHPQHRGKGLAKALIAACITRAKDERARAIGLFTSELMLTAQRIYKSLGFQLESELPMRHGIRYFRYVLLLCFDPPPQNVP